VLIKTSKFLLTVEMSTRTNLIIYDWDDTLLNTSEIIDYCTRSKINHKDPKVVTRFKSTFHQMDITASQLITLSYKLGDVIIITNADEGWVQSTCELYLPKLFNIITALGIPIISALKLYKLKTGNEDDKYSEWKYITMKHVLEHNDQYNKMVSIGDSDNEKLAALKISKLPDKKHMKIKTIKLTDLPTSSKMVRQHSIILAILTNIDRVMLYQSIDI
jgi:hypothetical protein